MENPKDKESLLIERRIYPRPPIVEAVAEFGFASPVSADVLLGALGSKLGDRYQGRRQEQHRVEFTATVAPATVATAARRSPHVTFLASLDGVRLVGCGERVMSVHVLAPYPGWESFAEQIEDAVSALPDLVRSGGLATLAVRYIDHIVLPKDASSYYEFSNIMPPCPTRSRSEGDQPALSFFHVVTQSVDPSDGTTALLTLASGPPQERLVIIYDLTLRRRGFPLCGIQDKSWRQILESLHLRQRELFESSITDQTRELFK